MEIIHVLVVTTASVRDGRWENPFARISLAPWLAFAMVTYWFLHAGDGYKERQLLTLFPLGLCEWVVFASTCWKKGLKEGVAVIPVAIIALLMPATHFSFLYDFRGFDLPSYRIWQREINIVNSLKRDYPEFKSIAADKLGFIGYFAGPDIRVDDMLGLGLADVHIARQKSKYAPNGDFVPGHCKYDVNYSLSVRKPDVVFMIVYNAVNLGHCYIEGLDRPILEENGYKLAYLSSYRDFRCVDVRDDEVKLQRLLSTGGYNLAVYVREGLPHNAG